LFALSTRNGGMHDNNANVYAYKRGRRARFRLQGEEVGGRRNAGRG
jgi:hypothetical protein